MEWTGANAEPEAFRRAGYRLILDHPRSGTHGLALFVRDGIEAVARLHDAPVPGPCRLPYLAARLRIDPSHPAGASPEAASPSRHLTFLGVHAPPPVPSCQGGNRPYLEALAALVSDGRLRRDVAPGRRGDPILLAGDLNALPASSALAAHHRAGLADVLRKAKGRILKPTWAPLPALPSLIRIDTILAGPDFQLLSAWTLDVPASDHRAVLADLTLPLP